ncbi:hypothetical protein E0K96_10750 [Massilimicrobiota sp. SW1139]|nr:hypothetical protein [Massilimicrobiota sp. SW1139]
MKTAILISYYDWYDKRLIYLDKELTKQGYAVQYYTSNIDHYKKEKIISDDSKKIFIDVPLYKKNISIKRMYSLYIFSKKITKIILQKKPDFVYCLVPPNYLIKELSNIKKNMKFDLVFDVIDMWPESLPQKKLKKNIIYKKWQDLRKNINLADMVVVECDRYQEILDNQVDNKKLITVRLAKKYKKKQIFEPLDSQKLSLCYLGSINSLIDIDCICKLIESFRKITMVDLHIIGDGNTINSFIEATKHSGANVYYHGKIFDEEKKQVIFNKCHYGLNTYKESTLIGLTIKSIDYFAAGLPIINNIKGDTETIVKKYNVGINVNDIKGNIIYDDINYKKHVFESTRNLFDESKVINDYSRLLEILLKRKEI